MRTDPCAATFLVRITSIVELLSGSCTAHNLHLTDLCHGIAAVAYDFTLGCIRWLFFSERLLLPPYPTSFSLSHSHFHTPPDLVEPIVLVLAGLAYGLCLGLAIVIQAPIRAAQDRWTLRQSRRRVRRWRDAGPPRSSRSRASAEYQHLVPVSSSIPSA